MTPQIDPKSSPVPSSPGASADALPAEVAQSWRRFIERCETLRPELYRYCRYLTRSPWEADDLVQDTLARAFVTLGCVHQEIASPRAWLFRVASNLWLNHVRGARELLVDTGALERTAGAEPADGIEPRATREAAGTLLVSLAPQERAAVVLKDVFDLSLGEIAEVLATSVGAVKAALHRGRGKLVDREPAPGATVVPAALDAFCEAFNARDLDRVTALLLDTAVVEFPGLAIEYGAEAARSGSLAGVLFGPPSQAIAPQFRAGLADEAPRLELRAHRGEPLLLGWFAHADGEAVRAISRVTLEGDRIARLRTYLHAPEVLAEICAELEVPFRPSGYRYWW